MKTLRNLNEEFRRELTEASEYDDSMGLFVATLLASSAITHMMHLKTRSYAQHMALGAYYPAIHEVVDGLVESYQGKYGLIVDYPTSINNDNTDPLSYLENISQFIKVKRLELPNDSEIQNDIDTIVTLVDSTVYKLKYLA